MDFDKNSLKKLLTLSDEELMRVLEDIAREAGVEKKISISKADVKKIRTLLSFASEDDIKNLINSFGGNKK